MTTNVVELWLRLMSDAMRGAADAQEAMRMLGEAPTTPDQLTRWMARFMPNAAVSAKPDTMEDWLEDTWRMMGVVPRYRYLELLERHEMLRSRLERAEKEIEKVRENVGSSNVPEQDVQKVLDLWENMLQETLKTQANWLRSWTAASEKERDKADDSPQTSQDVDEPKDLNPRIDTNEHEGTRIDAKGDEGRRRKTDERKDE